MRSDKFMRETGRITLKKRNFFYYHRIVVYFPRCITNESLKSKFVSRWTLIYDSWHIKVKDKLSFQGEHILLPCWTQQVIKINHIEFPEFFLPLHELFYVSIVSSREMDVVTSTNNGNNSNNNNQLFFDIHITFPWFSASSRSTLS